jgi:hypothetical protein
MHNSSATEIIALHNADSASPELSYKPVYIVTDKRVKDPTLTTMKYLQVGGPLESDRIGNTVGAIYKIEFADLSNLSATHIKVWAIHNTDASAVVYPVSYLDGVTLDLILWKFEFASDLAGTPVAAGGTYSIMGHRTNQQPLGIG